MLLTELVPTRVGMILVLTCLTDISTACPHTRGDDPKKGSTYYVL